MPAFVFRFVLALALALGLVARASGAEAILHFDTRIEVQRNGDLVVTEAIEVRVEGQRIKRGIFRDFPTYNRLQSGLLHTVGFDVESVLRDGRKEPWHTERINGGTRVYIGDADVLLKPAVYRYELRYRTTRQLGQYPAFDEVYWNATGNLWWFPILNASATVVLPDGAKPIRQAFYTGRRGAQGKDARIVGADGGAIRFEMLRPLQSGEGLTVAVAFDKGAVPSPTALEERLNHLRSNIGFYAFALGPVLMALWYGWAWRRVGRDPPKGLMIPLFEPPDGVSPAAASYLFYRGAGKSIGGASRALVAALMSLAVKGRIKLQEEGKRVRITRSDGAGPESAGDPLPPGEQALFTHLVGARKSIVLEPSNAKLVRPAITAFSAALASEYEKRYFRRNYLYVFAGLLIAGLALAALATGFRLSEMQTISTVLCVVAGLVGSELLMQGIGRLSGDVPGGSRVAGTFFAAIGAVVLAATVLLFVFGGLGLFGAPLFGADLASSVIAVAAITCQRRCSPSSRN
ncbi:MAG: DUF2207 domain-containing protein [Burkholderiaceae bacterium]